MGRGLDGLFFFWPACSFQASPGRVPSDFGGHGEGEKPLPIPNRAVKPLSADGTWPARARESRTPPVICWNGPPLGRPVLRSGPPRAGAASPPGRRVTLVPVQTARLELRPIGEE